MLIELHYMAIFGRKTRLGDQLWERFNARKEDQLWFYRGGVEAFNLSGYSGLKLEELRSLVDKRIRQTSNAT